MTNVRESGLNIWSEVSVALGKAGFTTVDLEKIINSPDNKMAHAMLDIVVGPVDAEMMEILSERELEIPEFYSQDSPGKYIEHRLIAHRERISTALNSENMTRMTRHDAKVKSRRYIVKEFAFKRNGSDIDLRDLVRFVRLHNGIQSGLSGLMLVYTERWHWPKYWERRAVSINEKGDLTSISQNLPSKKLAIRGMTLSEVKIGDKFIMLCDTFM